MKCAFTHGETPLYDFIDATKPIHPEWAYNEEIWLTRKLQENPKETPDVHDLIEDFRNYCRRNAFKPELNHSQSFATYKEKKPARST